MGNLTSTPTQVYEQTADWKFTRNSIGGVTAQRKFLETDTVLSSSTKVPLPRIGDFWDENNTDVVAKQIVTTFLCFNTFMHTVAYDTVNNLQLEQPLSSSATQSPTGLDIGSENISWQPIIDNDSAENTWTWGDGPDVDVNQNLYKIIGEGNLRKQRVVSDMDAYSVLVFETVGKVNKNDFLGFLFGNVLFEGANTRQSSNRIGEDRWIVDLNFRIRVIDGGSDSWQKLLRAKDGTFQTLKNPNGDFLYEEANLDELFSSGPLGAAENLGAVAPPK